MTTPAAATLADLLWPASRRGSLRAPALAVLGTLLLWASAKVQVPFWPVPMTLQTGMVLMLGVAYGWRLAGLTVLLYLGEGLIGLPVFAGTPEKGIGLAYMMGPTGGYLAGFLVAAMIAGLTAERSRGLPTTALGLLLAIAATYALGAAWLAGFVGTGKAFALGVTPFLLAETVKVALVIAVTEAGLGRLRRTGA